MPADPPAAAGENASAGAEGAGPSPAPSAAAATNPERWVDDYGDYLFSFAFSRLRSRTQAEDLVQETFLAALRSRSRFAGRGTERTWLTGILRNKILDYFRTRDRERLFTDLELNEDAETDDFVSAGLRKGAWARDAAPVDWTPKMGESLDHEEFWKTFGQCADKLPVNAARIFMLREMDQVSTREIGALMKMTENNVGVILHRARLALRRCLETNWIKK